MNRADDTQMQILCLVLSLLKYRIQLRIIHFIFGEIQSLLLWFHHQYNNKNHETYPYQNRFLNQLENSLQNLNHIMKSFRFKTQPKAQNNNAVGKEDLINILSHVINNYQLGSSRIDLKNEEMSSDHAIKLTNRPRIARREKYSRQIKEEMDPRDKQIILPFQTTFNVSKFNRERQQHEQSPKCNQNHQINSETHLKQNIFKLTHSKVYCKLREQLFEYISEVCQIVNSVGFQLLNQSKLTENEVKAFASKNILENIQSVLSEINEKLIQSNLIDEKQMEEVMKKLVEEIDGELKQILSQLASYYPQAPAVGETARIRQVITDVNRSQDDTNDLILTKNIKISEYLVQSNDIGPEGYTGFIMEVINAAINIAREPFSDGQEETVFEKFHQFSERLFSTSQHCDFKKILDKINGNEEVKDLKQVNLENKVIEHYSEIFNLKKDRSAQPSQRLPQEPIEQMRGHHKYGIAQKIANYVKPFSRSDIEGNNFHVNNSSVLRIMTKWADYLEEIFEKPEHYIYQRVYDFKNINNQPISLKPSQKATIVNGLKREYLELKQQLKQLKSKNTLFQSYILAHNEASLSSYLKRFTEVRSASSEITVILIQLTRKYLCLLIDHLIKAGQSNFNIVNLIVFRVGDLLRSKFQCSETTFINVLNTLYLLDKNRLMENRFKLVRIKNKLNQKDNNILINYLFLGKVQCELQLSIQDLDKKDKNYYAFCHFLYELTRGKFGVITECATIVSQHDPVVNGSDSYYRPKHYRALAQRHDKTHSIHTKDESVFMCWQCRRLAVRQNAKLFSEIETTCNECIAKSEQPEQKMVDDQMGLKECLLTNLKQKNIQRVRNYSSIKANNYILSISNSITSKVRGGLKLFKVWENKRQFKLVLIEISTKVLANFDQSDFNYDTINSFQVNKKQSLSQLTYLLDDEDLPMIANILQIQSSLLERIKEFQKAFESFVLEASIIKSIKFKQEIFYFRNDPQKLQTMNKVARAFGEKKIQNLKYKRYNSLQYNHIKKVDAAGLNLIEVPFFLKYTENLKILQLHQNKLSQFSLQNCLKLQRLTLFKNKLQSVDLKGLPRLRYLNISSNPISEIDLSKNTLLCQLALNNARLQKIDLTQNTQLFSINLLYNRLTSVSFSFSPKQKNQIDLSYQESATCQVNMLHLQSESDGCKQFIDQLTEIMLERDDSSKYIFNMIAKD